MGQCGSSPSDEVGGKAARRGKEATPGLQQGKAQQVQQQPSPSPPPRKAPPPASSTGTGATGASASPTDEQRGSMRRNPDLQQKSAQRSAIKKRSAMGTAEKLLAAHAGFSFHDHYERPTLVSYGASCKVLVAYHRVTGAKVACKTIPKSTRNPGAQRLAILNEIGIMKEVEDHPNAIRLLEVYDTSNNYYIVMDCCDGGELFEHITKSKEVFTERHAAQILRSLMLFLAHMHSKGMAHMDIKPENIMFDSEGAQGVVKVIDFGSSVYIQPEETVRDAFGTVRYSSPEMAADDGIGQKTDVWSAGIVMYFMLCGSAPFLKRDEVDTLNYIKNKPKVKFSGSRWAIISKHAKDCISAMLEVEPDKRPTAQEVLQMPWLRIQGPDTSIQSDILLHLRTFANQSRMRRLLLGLMAANLSGSEANRLLNQFYSMDSDFSGTIELSELAKVTQQALPDLDAAEVEKLFYALDLNHTGTVDVKEFFASLLHTMAPENQVAVARKSFFHLDREQSGFVSKEVFVDAMVRQAVASGMAVEETATLVKELEAEFRALDANSDGKLSFEEFRSVLGLEVDDGEQHQLPADPTAAGKGQQPSATVNTRQASGRPSGRFTRVPSGNGANNPTAGSVTAPTSGHVAGSDASVHASAGGARTRSGTLAALAAGGGAGAGVSSDIVRLALAYQETIPAPGSTSGPFAAVGSGDEGVPGGGRSPAAAPFATPSASPEPSGLPTMSGSRTLSGRSPARVRAASLTAPTPSGRLTGLPQYDAGAHGSEPGASGPGAASRSASMNRNPATAAAAAGLTAAVAATSLLSDANADERLKKKEDLNWPRDPAASGVSPTRKALSGKPRGWGSGAALAAAADGENGATHDAATARPEDVAPTWQRDTNATFESPSLSHGLGLGPMGLLRKSRSSREPGAVALHPDAAAGISGGGASPALAPHAAKPPPVPEHSVPVAINKHLVPTDQQIRSMSGRPGKA